jgi:hypothetical protein
MTYAEKLLACRNARIRCAGIYKRIDDLENSIELAGSGLEKPYLSRGLAAKIDLYKKELETEWNRFDSFQEEFLLQKDEALELIKPLPQAWQRLLHLRYIEARDWEWIYGYLPHGKDGCRSMHEEALEALKATEDSL